MNTVLMRIRQLVLAGTATIALVVALPAAPLAAAPSAGTVAASQAAVDRAVKAYAEAQAEADKADAAMAQASARLDELVAREREAQLQLESHVSSSYRLGPLSFIEVVMGAADFQELSTRWYFLTQINETDARLLADVRTARKKAAEQATRALRLQEASSKRQRALEKAAADAKADLANSKASYAEYQKRVTALAGRAAERKSSSAAKKTPDPTQTRTGTGDWSTGVASHYGRGSWGHRTADGTVIRSDSMIVAHKTLPFGTLVEFEYNGKRAVGRVADRGPYTAGRMWDLGPGVIRVLGFNGVHEVRYRIIGR